MEKYEVLRIAGRGAYGTAYLARRKTDGREVILKQGDNKVFHNLQTSFANNADNLHGSKGGA